jgi:hypothetical protein
VMGSRRYSRVALQRRNSAKKQMCPYHMPLSPLHISNSVPNFSSVFAFCLSSTIITIIFLPLSFLHPECTYFNLMFAHKRIMPFTFVLMQPTSFFKLSFLNLKFSTLRYNIWVKWMSSFQYDLLSKISVSK